MRYSQQRISEAEAAQLLAIAAQLHAKHQQSFSIEELMQAGEAADIPAAVVYQALVQARVQQRRPAPPLLQRRYLLPLLGAAIGLILSLPLYPATKSGEYGSLEALYVGELTATVIRVFPPSAGLLAGVWMNRRRS